MMKNRMFGIKKCFQEFGMFELGVRETFSLGYHGLNRHGGTPEAQNRRGTSPEVPRSLRMATY